MRQPQETRLLRRHSPCPCPQRGSPSRVILASEAAAEQELLAQRLGTKGIIRVRDAYTGKMNAPQIEDLLRTTSSEVSLKSSSTGMFLPRQQLSLIRQ